MLDFFRTRNIELNEEVNDVIFNGMDTIQSNDWNIFKEIFSTHWEGFKEFVSNVQKGEVPSRYHSLAKYIAKYVVSPPISLQCHCWRRQWNK